VEFFRQFSLSYWDFMKLHPWVGSGFTIWMWALTLSWFTNLFRDRRAFRLQEQLSNPTPLPALAPPVKRLDEPEPKSRMDRLLDD